MQVRKVILSFFGINPFQLIGFWSVFSWDCKAISGKVLSLFSTNQLFASLKLSARNCTRTLAIMGSRAILPESGHYALNFICKQWSLFKHVLHFRFPFFFFFFFPGFLFFHIFSSKVMWKANFLLSSNRSLFT